MKQIVFSVMICFFVIQTSYAENEKYLLVSPSAGLLNRLRSLASAYATASHLNRQLIIVWNKSSGHHMNVELDELFQNNFPVLEQFTEQIGIKSEDLEKVKKGDSIPNIYSFKLEKKGPSKIQDTLMDPEIAKISMIYLFNAWRNFKPRDLELEDYLQKYIEFYKNLRPIKVVEDKIAKYRNEYLNDDDFLIGLHIRNWTAAVGDGIYQHVLKKASMSDYFYAMDQAIKNAPKKKVRFYLATDDPEIRPLLQKRYKDKILPSPIQEISRSTSGQQDALIDWYLLAASNYIIGTFQSSFSDEAALLTKERRKINVGASDFGFQQEFYFDSEGVFCHRDANMSSPNEFLD